MRKVAVGMMGLWLAAVSLSAAEQLSYQALVDRLTDLEFPARLPDPGERAAQFSSFDRASRYNAETGKYERWDANGDGGGFIRLENGEQVLAEMEGPGCIWRIWSANPNGRGRLKIVLDGAEQPVFHDSFRKLFDGGLATLPGGMLTYVAARGFNCYIPIPFQKSCRITAEPEWGQYYHFNYSTFPEGTTVPTFHLPLAAEELAALQAAERKLAAGYARPQTAASPVRQELELAPGATATRLQRGEPGAIVGWELKFELPGDQEAVRAMLRNLIVEMRWDGAEQPAVWSPLGDFFGSAPGLNPYQAWPLGMLADGTFYSRWFMPFAAAEVKVVNRGTQPVKLTSSFWVEPLKRPLAEYGRFHAKWHGDGAPLPEPERQAIDWRVLETRGRGRWCGMMLHVWNPLGSWWGEGDEKFYVDGEKFPSTFGTGSEDYFGYAWCNPELFSKPFHTQSISEDNAGHISVNRFQLCDQIPFQKSFEADLEKYFRNDRPTRYRAVAYWYLDPAGSDPYGAVAASEMPTYPKLELRKPGVLEFERLRVISCSTGAAGGQHMRDFLKESELGTVRWSDVSQLFWRGSEGPGGRLEVEFPVNEDGRYALEMQFTKAPDYGKIQVSLDGRKLGEEQDLYADKVIPTGALQFGEVDLTKGPHRLSFELTGKNPASRGFLAGFDYLLLTPVK